MNSRINSCSPVHHRLLSLGSVLVSYPELDLVALMMVSQFMPYPYLDDRSGRLELSNRVG